MKINVIGVPLNLGCDREGVERAPNHLRERGLMKLIRGNGHRAFDLGNLYVPPVSEADKFARGNSMKYLDAIVEVNNNLAELVYDTLRGGAFPLVIGGDHSLGLGSASGVGKCYDDFGIIWLDAHADINTSETSPSGNIHGMPLSALMGMGSEELVNVYAPGNKVNPQNVFLVGTRSLDEGEWELIEREKLSVYTMETIHLKGIGFVAEDIKRKLKEEAEAFREEDASACRKIGEWGLGLLRPGMGLLTHCNAGHLAVSEYGTALAPVYLGQERGYSFHVYADETRPLLQGARLTAFELQRAGVDVTLICDNMASCVMQQGKVQAVLVGCDRVAANGDTANKNGTSGVAVLAKYYGIPFYVLGPTSTVDFRCPDGNHIPIEERDPGEVAEKWYLQRMAPEGVDIFNPAFDVTAHELITAIITEKGIAYPPFGESLTRLAST